MGEQNVGLNKTEYQKTVLDLEKKYFGVLENIINSQGFVSDLLLIEKEIEENYQKIKDVWNLKNKIKVPVERLIRQHVYMALHDKITGIYPSPISSDLGIRLEDAVVCVDAKTIDTNGNANDLKSTQVEQNQNSFNNKNYPFVNYVSNLDAVDHFSRLPVLTYVIKIVYYDDNYLFKLERGTYPSIVLICIPNGELSNLFDYNIIDNFKTYSYYKETDGEQYKPIIIPNMPEQIQIELIKKECEEKRHFQRIQNDQFDSKIIYYDPATRVTWWETSINKKKVIAPLKSGSSVRYNNLLLKKRFDSQNHEWEGYKEFQLPQPLINHR